MLNTLSLNSQVSVDDFLAMAWAVNAMVALGDLISNILSKTLKIKHPSSQEKNSVEVLVNR
jgi:hypothetical protein